MILSLVLVLASAPVEEAPASPCTTAITHQIGSNTLQLGAGSKACEEEGRTADAAFLNVLARIRANADMILLPPQNILEVAEREDFKAVLAGRSEYVDEELARNAERFAALLERVRQADLSIPIAYDPGWVVADNNKRELYAEVIDGLRTDKVALESYIAKLVRDDAYYAAYLERVAMLSSIGEDGAQLPERFGEVAKIMRARVDILGDPPTETVVPWRKVYEPGPNAPFALLHRGFNGPVQTDTLLFRSALEVRQSWVGNALSEEELSQVLSRIDFETEVLGVYAVGEMHNASENLFVTEFGANEDFGGHSIAVRVGVVGEHCDVEESRSYPFVLVKASSNTEEGLNSSSRANYPDQCIPVMAGKPTVVPVPALSP
jgi:hypothetical protein